jgi:hypothetical protein
VKSPQAVMGTVVKSIVAEALGVAPDELFHATVMPCFDKKLEASRADFSISSKSSGDTNMSFTTQETDCVLTTGEVAQLIADAAEASGGVADRSAFGADAAARGRAGAAALARAPRAALDGWLACAGTGTGTGTGPFAGDTMETDDGDARVSVSSDAPDSNREFLYAPHVPGGGGGSGGYLDYTFRRAAYALFGVTVSGPLPFKTPRAKNPDLREVTLEVGGKTVLRFATAYGFRNIQNVVRKCKASSNNPKSGGVSSAAFSASASSYDFVEIMACPSGCLNGGGQLPPPPAFEPGFRLSADAPLPQSIGVGHTAKQLLDDLEELYHTGSIAGLAYDGKSGGGGERPVGERRRGAIVSRVRGRRRGVGARESAVAHAVPRPERGGGRRGGGERRGGGQPQDKQRLVERSKVGLLSKEKSLRLFFSSADRGFPNAMK